MHTLFLTILALVCCVFGSPILELQSCSSPVSLAGNPFSERALHPTKKYTSEVQEAAAAIIDPKAKALALKVANTGTFLWLDTPLQLTTLENELQDIPCSNVLGIVLRGLSQRFCAAIESPPYQVDDYKSKFIDPLAKILKKYSNNAVVAIVEPHAIPPLVINRDLSTCQQDTLPILDGIAYAMRSLNLPNVNMYLDLGHGGALGWNNDTQAAAQMVSKVFMQAGSPKNLRGFATNVANYNSWSMSPGEFTPADDAKYNLAQNEKIYVSFMSTALKAVNVPNQAIVDSARNGIQGLREESGEWCNVNGATFGTFPTNHTDDLRTDAFVWAKPPGESDGTSDPNMNTYDSYCGRNSAFKPSPDFGVFDQAYFEMMIRGRL